MWLQAAQHNLVVHMLQVGHPLYSVYWVDERISEVERIWKQMWHNLLQYPSMCLKKFRKTRI